MSALPIDVVFLDMPASPAVDAFVRRWATRLHRTYDRIERCEVVISLPHRHHEHGRLFEVRLHVAVPGDDLVIDAAPVPGAHEDVRVAVRDAFRAARRRLARRAERTRAHRVPELRAAG